MKFTPGLSVISAVSTCWGLLLTSMSFVSIVWWSKEEVGVSATVNLFCEALILTLGTIQTLFSLLLFLAPNHKKQSWTTVWICTHILIAISLIFTYILHSNVAVPNTNDSMEIFHHRLTTLDVVMFFDFLFLALFFFSLLLEFPNTNEESDSQVITTNDSPIVNPPSHFNGIINTNFQPFSTVSSKVVGLPSYNNIQWVRQMP